jgi:hypothetical protein
MQNEPPGSLVTIIPPPRSRDTAYLRDTVRGQGVDPAYPTSVVYTPIYPPYRFLHCLLYVQPPHTILVCYHVGFYIIQS